MIYFIGTNKKIKIGYCKESTGIKRLNSMSRDNPEELFLYCFLTGDRITEQYYHQKFKKYHIKNEWFGLEGELKKFLEKNKIEIVSNKIKKRKRHFTELSKIRLNENISLQNLANKLGIKVPSVWQKELSYDSETISIKCLKEYCNALGYDVKIDFIKKSP